MARAIAFLMALVASLAAYAPTGQVVGKTGSCQGTRFGVTAKPGSDHGFLEQRSSAHQDLIGRTLHGRLRRAAMRQGTSHVSRANAA